MLGATWRTLEGGAVQQGGLSACSPSEDGDALSSVSATMSDVRRTSVTGLRDRLLREARSERQRCLEVAKATERRGVSHMATQTDHVVIMDAAPTGSIAEGTSPSWSYADDAAQADALRTIQLLGQRGNQSRGTESRVCELEAELRAERAGLQELDGQVSHERSRKEAAQQQVLCLEYELDGKEAALQVAERALERRDAELQQAQQQLRALQEEAAERPFSTTGFANEEARVHAFRTQLLERERQLELKDQHISRLLNVLRQHRSILAEEDSAAPLR